MKKLFFSAVALVAGLGAVNAQTVPYVLSHVADTAYAVTMTQEEIAAKYDATWVTNAWSIGVALPEGTVMYENDSLTIKAGVENTPVYTSGGKITQITEEWPGYTGYVNAGSSLAQNGWTGEEQILTLSEFKANNQGIVTVTPKVDGKLKFGVYAGDNTRSIGIYRLDETMENYGWQAMNNSFRNDGENGTVKNAPAYVEAQVKKDSVYALMAGGNKNLCMHQIVFVPSATEPSVPYILSEVEDNVYAVTMTQEEIAAKYDAEWVTNAWSIGAALPAGTVMYENDELTIKAGVDGTPVYTSGGKITQITSEWPGYTGYVNAGSTLAQNGWTGEEQILTLSEFKANNQGIVTVTPKVAGTLKFGVYAGDNTRSIGIYKLDEDNMEDYGWVSMNNSFRNDGENGTVKNAPAYVEGAVEANRVYALMAGGNKNLCMHQISFVPGTTGINSVAVEKTVNNGIMYNLAGQRVDKAYKGIVIMNGKKFMNK